ncbi:MAG TPA: hypothetical protein RMH99_28575 [Sandaracinaceae bacterium LLY-WYZ-13_1]|nr:hypothetical protein [Sandaracinaceae bacterium LLY-WYZ-13_1]
MSSRAQTRSAAPPGAFDQRSLAAYAAFFLSGASSLIFQTIWTRMLHHVFGAAPVAISTVLTVFMGGLGLGAWLGGKYAHRIKHPIITYAIAEVGVGLWGLLIPLLVQSDGWLSTVNAFLRAEFGAESGMFMAARFLCVAPILIIPTTLMGSTLPLLTRHFVRAQHQAREAGARVGILYAINTLGAASGPLLSAFVLMPNVGLLATNVVACSMNFTLAALIWLTKRPLLEGMWKPGEKLEFWPGSADRVEAESTDGTAEPAEAPADEAPPPDAEARAERELAAKEDEAPAKAERGTRARKKKRRKRKKKDAPKGPSVPDADGVLVLGPDEEAPELPIPELARKGAFIAFAASGAAALCYEVVWSRALAMTIGSSIYSFALILETFLVGIAVGSAAMSAFLGQKSKPYLGIGLAAIALVVLANVPWAVDIVDPQDTAHRFEGSLVNYALLCLLYASPIVLAIVWVYRRIHQRTLGDVLFREDEEAWRPVVTVLMASIPVAAAAVNTFRFPGHLPKIILTVVSLVALFVVIASLLSRVPILLVAIIQIFIAGATLASYVWQDEIPYAFAQLVVSIPTAQLPDHVWTVWGFNNLTIALCTLPSSLGMGAMFPLVVRVWTTGGDRIARDVAHVYTGNTLGSIVGSWLPGFILFALVGAERTLHLGIALNMLLALMMLIAGAADPTEDQRWWTWRRLGAIALPALAAFMLGASAYPADTEDWRWWTRVGAAAGFLILSVLEYQWLRATSDRAGREERAPDAVGYAMSALPLLAGVALAVFAVEPAEHAEWAASAALWILRAFLVLTGLVASLANWREMTRPTPPLQPLPIRKIRRRVPAGTEAVAQTHRVGWVSIVALGLVASVGLAGLTFALSGGERIVFLRPTLWGLAVLIAGGSGFFGYRRYREAHEGHGEYEEIDLGVLPTWHAVTVYVLSPLIPALLALLWLGTKHPDSMLRWNRTQMTLGVFRVSLAEGMLDPDSWGSPDLVYYEDGLTTTVSVERWGRHYALKNNGKVDASNGDDMPTQINVAAYPLLLHPEGPTDLDVAVVGFGSGVSVGTALQFPVRRVDVIELERSIPEAARFFEDINHLDYRLDHWPYVQMDRLTVVNDDGRNYLASTRQQYDVIISEPSNPWITGVSDLFTVDHWRITKQRLRPGGIYCQWVQLYELSPENIKTIYRTFASQFDHVLVLSADDRSSDTVMLGSDQPILLDLERVQAAYALPGVSEELERANIFTPFDLFARTLLATREEVMRYTHIEHRRRGGEMVPNPASSNSGSCPEPECERRPAVLNTDDNARIEFAAPRDLIGFARYEGYLSTIYSPEWPYGHPLRATIPIGTGGACEEAAECDDDDEATSQACVDGTCTYGVPVLRGFGQGDEASRNYAELAMSMIAHGRYGWAGDLIEESQEAGRSRETALAAQVYTHLLTTENEPPIRIEPPIPGPEMDRDTAEALVDGFDAVRDAVDEHAYGAALIAMENIPAPLRLHSGPAMRFLYGYLLYKAADGSYAQYRAAIEHLEDLVRTEEDYVLRHPEVYYFLARAHDADGDYAQALRAMRAYVEARLVPVDDDAEAAPEPPPGEAPTTDAPGTSPKDEHPDRG